MTSQEFEQELKRIQEQANKAVTELVNKAQADEGLEWDTDKPVSFVDHANWNYPADAFAELTGWIYDRLAGRNRLHKKSVTKKIRKALGYTYP